MMKKMTMALNSVQFPFLPSNKPRKAMLQKRLQERLKTVRRLQLAAKTEGKRTLPTPIRPAPATEPGLTLKINTIMPTISPGRTVTFFGTGGKQSYGPSERIPYKGDYQNRDRRNRGAGGGASGSGYYGDQRRSN